MAIKVCKEIGSRNGRNWAKAAIDVNREPTSDYVSLYILLYQCNHVIEHNLMRHHSSRGNLVFVCC